MDVNSISNNISNLNNIPQQQTDKVSSNSQVENNEEFLKISISDYNTKRDELSASLQTFNEGIGISKTAEYGLENQKENLTNIQNILENLQEKNLTGTDNNTDNNDVKKEINQELLKFKEEAFQTKYKMRI